MRSRARSAAAAHEREPRRLPCQSAPNPEQSCTTSPSIPAPRLWTLAGRTTPNDLMLGYAIGDLDRRCRAIESVPYGTAVLPAGAPSSPKAIVAVHAIPGSFSCRCSRTRTASAPVPVRSESRAKLHDLSFYPSSKAVDSCWEDDAERLDARIRNRRPG